MNKRDSLYLEFTGDIARMRALLAFLSGHNAGWILDIIDQAEHAGVNEAREISDAIREAAHKAGVR